MCVFLLEKCLNIYNTFCCCLRFTMDTYTTLIDLTRIHRIYWCYGLCKHSFFSIEKYNAMGKMKVC